MKRALFLSLATVLTACGPKTAATHLDEPAPAIDTSELDMTPSKAQASVMEPVEPKRHQFLEIDDGSGLDPKKMPPMDDDLEGPDPDKLPH